MMDWKEAKRRASERGCPAGCACRECCLDEAAMVIGGPVPERVLLPSSGGGLPSSAPAPRRLDLPTDRQLDFIASLCEGRDLGDATERLSWVAVTYPEFFAEEPQSRHEFGPRQASVMIDALKQLPRRGQAERALANEIESKRVEAEFEEGALYVGPELEEGQPTIYLVQRSKSSGHLYALRVLDDGRTTFDSGAIRRLDAGTRLSLEAAKAWGRRTGVCCQCRRELTNPESIELGIGPYCRKKFA